MSPVQRILVTGAAGFIGSHLVDRLLGDGHEVVGADNFDDFYSPEIKERNLASARRHPRFTLIRADVREPELAGVCGELDAIVHLAARAGVRPSLANPLLYHDVNVRGTAVMLELARARRVRQFVYASSSSVYGTNANVPWRESDHVLLPISPYAATKVAGELLGHVYSQLFGIRFLALRFFTVYGPRQRPDLAIHKFARAIMRGEPIPVFGDGSTRRDYTYVDDVVEVISRALAYAGSSYEVVNVGNDRTIRLSELIGLLERELGAAAIVERLPEQPGDVSQTWASTERCTALFGPLRRTDFREGLRAFVTWLRDAPAGSA